MNNKLPAAKKEKQPGIKAEKQPTAKKEKQPGIKAEKQPIFIHIAKDPVKILLVFILALGIIGCRPDPPETPESKSVETKGREIMQQWIDDNLPGAEIKDCSPFYDWETGSGGYLTDYATGAIVKDDNITLFSVNTLTGAVYLGERRDELTAEVSEYVCEAMNLTPEGSAISCYVMAPAKDGGSEKETIHDYFDLGLPAGTDNIREFVRDPDSRLNILLTGRFDLSDNSNISVYGLEWLDKLSEECGIIFDDLEFADTDSHLSVSTGKSAGFYETGVLKKEDLTLHLVTHYREESVDDPTLSARSGAKIIKEDNYLDPDKDIIIEKNADSYTYSIENKDWEYGFYIYAEAGSEALKHDYLHIPDVNDEFLYPKDKNNESRIPMNWSKQDDGSYALTESTHGTIPLFKGSGTLKISD
ncbi:MAG: hypothetical protein K6B28_07640 [Lachnospiraceae bacterium]|nr:hypothetical protein [Lachnospiraceae bacterium]